VTARRISHNFLYNLAGLVLPLGLAVLSVPLFARYAGLDRLGFLTLAFALVGYLGLLDLGLARVFSRRIAVAVTRNELDSERALLGRVESWLAAGTSVLAILLATAMPARGLAGAHASAALLGEVQPAWVVLAAALPALVLSNLWRGAIEGLEAFALSNALRIGFGVATYAVPMAILIWTASLPALVLGITTVRWVSYAFYRWACVRMLPSRTAAVPRNGSDPLRHAIFEGGWMTVTNVVVPIMVAFDRFALTPLITLSTLATYTIPQELALRALLLPGALSTTIFPRLAALDAGSETAQAIDTLVDKALRMVLALMLPACLLGVAVARPVLAAFVNAEFSAAATPLLAILVVGVIGNSIAQLPFGMLQAVGASRAAAIVHLIELPVYLGVMWFAIHRDGVQGAALAWAGRMVVDALAMMLLARRRQASIVTIRGAYASLVSLSMCSAVAGFLVWRVSTATAWVLIVWAASLPLCVSFLRRAEIRNVLAVASRALGAPAFTREP
jgi:O-antigen/teichoic acid export membrane protein